MKNKTTDTTIYKAGSVELTYGELEKATNNGTPFIVGHRKIWEILPSRNCGFRIVLLWRERGKLPLMPRGRFTFATGEHARKLSGGMILGNA